LAILLASFLFVLPAAAELFSIEERKMKIPVFWNTHAGILIAASCAILRCCWLHQATRYADGC